jgi:hypothetical protein
MHRHAPIVDHPLLLNPPAAITTGTPTPLAEVMLALTEMHQAGRSEATTSVKVRGDREHSVGWNGFESRSRGLRRARDIARVLRRRAVALPPLQTRRLPPQSDTVPETSRASESSGSENEPIARRFPARLLQLTRPTPRRNREPHAVIPIVEREPVSIVRRAPPTVPPSLVSSHPRRTKPSSSLSRSTNGATQSGILFLVSIEPGTSRRVYHRRP